MAEEVDGPLAPLRHLLAKWRDDHVLPKDGCPVADIEAFQIQSGLNLPQLFVKYLTVANGMGGRGQDPNGFAFWPLRRLARADRELADRTTPIPAFSGAHRFVAFADYLDWSWAYAIGGDEQSTPDGPVILIGDSKPIPIASTFAEFVGLYVRDDPRLYPPACA